MRVNIASSVLLWGVLGTPIEAKAAPARKLDVLIDSAIKYRGPLPPQMSAEADILNAELKNVAAALDVDAGRIRLSFDYPGQVWSMERNIANKTWFTPPLQLLVRVLDRNGEVLAALKSPTVKMPAAAIALFARVPAWLPLRWRLSEQEWKKATLDPLGNTVELSVNQVVAQSARAVEVGWLTDKLLDETNVWRPESTPAAKKGEIVKAPETGTIAFRIRPYATVLVDGQSLGDTPVDPITVPIGTVIVTLINKDLNKELKVPFEVKAGQNTFKYNLEE